jgi:hypothetical protein
VTIRGYGWYLGAFTALVVSGIAIAVAAVTLLESLTPLYISLVSSTGAILLAVIAWIRYPKPETA